MAQDFVRYTTQATNSATLFLPLILMTQLLELG
jgi:hypothetical protein